HLAFIAAASCARRSGVRFSFLFTFLAALGAPAEAVALLRAFPAELRDLLLALAAPVVLAAACFRFSLASFFASFFRRASSRRIFLVRFLSFIWDSGRANHSKYEWRIGFRVNDEIA